MAWTIGVTVLAHPVCTVGMSRSYSRSSHSCFLFPENRRSRNVRPPSRLSFNATGDFLGFSASAVPPVTVFPPPQAPCTYMRGLIRQVLADKLKSLSHSRKRSRSRSSSVEPVRRERRVSHTAPDPDPLDEHDGNTTDVQVSMGNDSSGASKDKPPMNSAPNDLNSGSSVV